MKKLRPHIEPRRRVFLGCEGESERGYGMFLQSLAKARGLALFIDAVVLQPGGGNPLEIVRKAIAQHKARASQNGAYDGRAILLDTDKLGEVIGGKATVDAKAATAGITLIWQRPCHEAFLLRHFEGLQTHEPATSQEAQTRLGGVWPDYEKGLSGQAISKRLDEAAVRRVMAVELELAGFLRRIGF